MILLVEANVLTVGLDGRTDGLAELPVRLINMRTGSEAIKCLRSEKIDSVISEWDLPDMADGSFLKGFKTVKPHMPTIAVVKPGDRGQEIAARSLGVAAVLKSRKSTGLITTPRQNLLAVGRWRCKGSLASIAIPARYYNFRSSKRSALD